MAGRGTSNVYFARPLTLSGPSRRLTRVPTTVFGVDVQLYFGSTGGACGAPPRPCFDEGLATLHPLEFVRRGGGGGGGGGAGGGGGGGAAGGGHTTPPPPRRGG